MSLTKFIGERLVDMRYFEDASTTDGTLFSILIDRNMIAVSVCIHPGSRDGFD